jgi:hypothetical protein
MRKDESCNNNAFDKLMVQVSSHRPQWPKTLLFSPASAPSRTHCWLDHHQPRPQRVAILLHLASSMLEIATPAMLPAMNQGLGIPLSTTPGATTWSHLLASHCHHSSMVMMT